MKSLFKVFGGQGEADRRQARKVHRASPELRAEALEERELLSVSFLAGVLTINGTAGSDTADVRIDNKGNTNPCDDQVVVREKGVETFRTARFVCEDHLFGLIHHQHDAVTKLAFNGFEGNDRFDNMTSIPSQAYGSYGNDTLVGGSSNDTLNGGVGDDLVLGGAGNDSLDGWSGNDQLKGGDGNDILYGRDGNDTMYGEGGNDTLYGERGQDDLYGGSGNDYLDGDAPWIGEDGLHDHLTGNDGGDRFVLTGRPLAHVHDFGPGDMGL